MNHCAGGARCELVKHVATVADRYAYLLGMYLGDGSIARHKRAYRLEIACCDDYPDIEAECGEAIVAVLPDHPVGVRQREGCRIVGAYSQHWPCLFPQHGAGAKHTRTIALEPWQHRIALDEHPDQFVRGLIHSDGCRAINRVHRLVAGRVLTYEYVRYFFSNRSADILGLFVEGCDRLGIDVRPNSPHSLSVARRASVAILDQLVGPKS